jgi:ubiquinone biosynthesis protein
VFPLIAVSTTVTFVVAPFFIGLAALTYAFAVRRLLGLRLGSFRTLLAGILAFLVASPLITALYGNGNTKNSGILPGLWFVLLGTAIALLAGMTFLVIADVFVPSGSIPGPVYVASGLRKRFGRTKRYWRIMRILQRRGLLPYLRGGRRSELRTADGRVRLARSVRLALEDGGVTFVKLGQVLATRRDLLPDEFIKELSGLQDDVAPVPWSDIDEVIRLELGSGVDELFAIFERTPLAAASIAQVHAATLHSGQRIVVKVCRPEAPAAVESDLAILESLAVRLDRSWGRSVGAQDLAHGFRDALREELDLRIEARNMTSVAAASALRGGSGIRIPIPVESMSARRVLVMERMDGRPISAVEPDGATDRDAMATQLLDCLLRQIMVDGIFHADPHPGNVFLLDDGDLGLLDFGSVGRIDAGMRVALQHLLLAVDRGDPTALTDALLEIVERPESLDEEKLRRTLGRFLGRHVAAGVSPDNSMFGDLFRIVWDHGLAIPPEIGAVFRCLATLEGTISGFDPSFNIVAETRRFASDYLAEQFRPDSLKAAATKEVTTLLPILRRLPRRIDRIGEALETGRLNLNIRLLADDRDRLYVTGLVHQFLLAFLAATSGIIAVLMLGLHGGASITTSVSLFQLLGYFLLVIAAILSLRVLLTVLRPDKT